MKNQFEITDKFVNYLTKVGIGWRRSLTIGQTGPG